MTTQYRNAEDHRWAVFLMYAQIEFRYRQRTFSPTVESCLCPSFELPFCWFHVAEFLSPDVIAAAKIIAKDTGKPVAVVDRPMLPPNRHNTPPSIPIHWFTQGSQSVRFWSRRDNKVRILPFEEPMEVLDADLAKGFDWALASVPRGPESLII